MNILLIKSFWPYPYSRGEDTYNRIWPPLSLLNCAALLEREGHKVKILDVHAHRISPRKIGDYIKGHDKIFITSSSLDKWQCPNIDISPFIETVRYLRETNDETYVLGYHGTVEPEKILNLTDAKAVIRGEPESTVLEICQNRDLFKIKGVFFKDNGEFVSTPQREPLDLESLPIPAFHLLDFKKYHYEILGDNFALFETSRGCKFRCRFCNKVMYGGGVRSKTKEQVSREVSLAVEKYNVKTGYFIDLDFLSNREIAEGVCDYLIRKQYKFKWTCQTRADFLDMEIIEKMKAAGCALIHTGIESSSQESLDYLNKNMTIDRAVEAVKLCRRFGIKTLAFFLFGLPGETEKDRKNTFKFIKKMNADFISLHKIYPYMESDIFGDDFELNADIDKFICKAYIKYYLRPSYLQRLSIFTAFRGLKLFYNRIKILS